MKKKLLIVISFAIFSINMQKLIAEVIIVPENYQDIQSAINAASSGDTVIIYPGVYEISATIDLKTGVSLIGFGADSTILEGKSATQSTEKFEGDLITARGQNSISYLQLRNAGDGIYLRGASVDIQSARISENVIANCVHGINFDNRYKVGTLWIINNTVLNCYEGIRDNDWNKVYMYNNIVVNCDYGINRFNVNSWTAEYNNVYNSKIKDWEGIIPNATNISLDPLFKDTLIQNYHLLSNSPCVNAGTPDISGLGLADTDPAGNPRIISNRIDMGVFETLVTFNNSDILKNEVIVYPNVSNFKIFISIENVERNLFFEIINIYGTKMNSGKINEKLMEIDISNYGKGLYFVRVLNRESCYIKKVIHI